MAVPILEPPLKPGVEVIKCGVFVYECPVCRKRESFDDAYGPACTGPRWTDEHPMTPMRLMGKR